MVIWLATFNNLHSALFFFSFCPWLHRKQTSWEPPLSRMDSLSSQWLGSGRYNEKQNNTIHWVYMHISAYLIDGGGKEAKLNLSNELSITVLVVQSLTFQTSWCYCTPCNQTQRNKVAGRKSYIFHENHNFCPNQPWLHQATEHFVGYLVSIFMAWR